MVGISVLWDIRRDYSEYPTQYTKPRYNTPPRGLHQNIYGGHQIRSPGGWMSTLDPSSCLEISWRLYRQIQESWACHTNCIEGLSSGYNGSTSTSRPSIEVSHRWDIDARMVSCEVSRVLQISPAEGQLWSKCRDLIMRREDEGQLEDMG
jgi:hypothetical protein